MSDLGLLESLLDVVADQHDGWGPVVVFLSSLIEYVFPPFPGDMVTLFGAFLVVRGLWSIPFALLVTTVGSLLGAFIDYQIGVWLGRRLDRLPREKQVNGWRPLTHEKYELVSKRFKRFGNLYVVINRFLPGIRAFIFVAAGASGMRLWAVLFYAAISALVWNGLIIGVGYAVGVNWEQLRDIFSSYTFVVWLGIGMLVLVGLIVWLLRRRAARQEKLPEEK